MFPRSRAQPRKPTPGLGADAHHDHRNVVRAAAIIRQVHQLLRRLYGVRLGLQGSCNFRLDDHARQAIGAQQQNIARDDHVLFGVDFHFRLRAQCAQQHALHLALFGFRSG